MAPSGRHGAATPFVWTAGGEVLDLDGFVAVADAHVEVAPTLALANAQALKAPCF